MLEEQGLAYEPHFIDIGKHEAWTPKFLLFNPNGKIPSIIVPTARTASRSPCSNLKRSCYNSPPIAPIFGQRGFRLRRAFSVSCKVVAETSFCDVVYLRCKSSILTVIYCYII